jgi:hypothetical protein
MHQLNYEVVLAAVRQNGVSLRLASGDLRNDPQVVAESLINTSGSRSLMGPQLKHQLECLAQTVEVEQARSFVDVEPALEHARQWKKTIWEKVWLAGQIIIDVKDLHKHTHTAHIP